MSGLVAVAPVAKGDAGRARAALGAAMLDRMAHRGPDGLDSFDTGAAWLGHALLATVPEDRGHRPVCRSADGAIVVVADARIDNRAEVAAQLGRRIATDVETILGAYERWGDHCASRLAGDFAFVVHDAHRGQLVCARDQLGARTLFWTLAGGLFRCASEMDAIFADGALARRPNLPALALFLACEYLERDETLYEGIRALPPGHTLVVGAPQTRAAEPVVRAFWQPDAVRAIRHRSDDEYAQHFASVFTEAVRARMRAVGPVSILVSGGLDSSALLGVAERLRRDVLGGEPKLEMVHMAFPGLPCDEDEYCDAVARRSQVPVFTLVPSDDSIPAPRSMAPDVYFNPLNTLWSQHFETARARGVRVTLTGVGSDQIMQQTGLEAADMLRAGHVGAASRLTGVGRKPLSASAWRRFAGKAVVPLMPRSLRQAASGLRAGPTDLPWMQPRFRQAVRDHRAGMARRSEARSARGPGTQALAHQLVEGYEVVFTLASLANHSARWAAEARHPYLDIRLVELLLAFPHEQRCGVTAPKPLIRRAFGDVLPDAIRNRLDGANFGPFVHRVLYQGGGDALAHLFSNSRLAALDLVDESRVSTLVEEVRRDWLEIRQVATLTSLELWLRQTFP